MLIIRHIDFLLLEYLPHGITKYSLEKIIQLMKRKNIVNGVCTIYRCDIIDYVLSENDDGITHINIYSRGQTELGRMLSNFYKFPIKTLDGDFMSVEGYWYWLSIEDCKEKELLRELYGFTAKKKGREILEYRKSRFDDNFEKKIRYAIWYKFRRNSHLITKEFETLPFEHYYCFGGKIMDVKKTYLWMVECIEKMRKYLVVNK